MLRLGLCHISHKNAGLARREYNSILYFDFDYCCYPFRRIREMSQLQLYIIIVSLIEIGLIFAV